MSRRTIFKRVSDTAPSKKHRLLERARHATTIPPDILRGASKRLAICGLVMAGISALWALVIVVLPPLGGPRTAEPFGLVHLHTFVILALSVGVYLLARSERLKPRQMLDLGLLYLIVVAFVAGVVMKIVPGPLRIPSGWGISEICVLILIFPVIIPNAAWKIFLAALLAASMDPMGIHLALKAGKAIPPGADIFSAVFPNYLCAALALIPSYIMNHLARQVGQAREMGSYRLTELLGRGGMGEVWRANHRLLAREAAIKLVRPEVLVGTDVETQDVLLRRFEREAQATSVMCSPHTIDLYDFGVSEDGTFYYVMELLDGFDVEIFVQRFGPVPAARAVHLLCQVCDSLAEAHESGLIHRDIKPANVYVCRYGRETDFIKVLDFGLVKPRADRETEDVRLTGEHAAGGTPAFMAPEQALGDPPVDARADIYAVGCVAYWLLTGQPVFEGETAMKVIAAHVHAAPVPPSQRTELRIPQALDAVVLGCLEKDPDQRPADADALAEMLRSSVAGDRWTSEQAREWWDVHLPREASRVQL